MLKKSMQKTRKTTWADAAKAKRPREKGKANPDIKSTNGLPGKAELTM